MDRQSQTFEGRMSTLKDKMQIVGSALGQVINDTLSPVLDAAIAKLDLILDKTGKMNKDADNQMKSFKNLQTNILPLIETYEKLRMKEKLSTDESKQMQGALNGISKAIPGSVSGWDRYGNVLSINTTTARNFKEQQEALFRLDNDKAQGAINERLAAIKKEREIGNVQLENNKQRGRQGLINNESSEHALKFLSQLTEEETRLAAQLSKLRGDKTSVYIKDAAAQPTGKIAPGSELAKLKDSTSKINGGGHQAVNVTINVDHLVEHNGDTNFNNVKDGAKQYEPLTIESLLRVLDSANYAKSQ